MANAQQSGSETKKQSSKVIKFLRKRFGTLKDSTISCFALWLTVLALNAIHLPLEIALFTAGTICLVVLIVRTLVRDARRR